MKIRKIPLAIVVLLCFIALTAWQGHAQEYRFLLGVVNASDGVTFVVNEGAKVKITDKTVCFNSRGKEIRRKSPKQGDWVYVEGTVDANQEVEAQKIYYLPGYVKHKDYKNYPFIQIPM